MDLTSYLLGKKKGGGGGTISLQDKSVTITENTTTTIQKDAGYDGLGTVEITTNVPQTGGTKENDVNFYDYDGILLYSYTKNEFAQLTEMPENPVRAGLIAEGWNWSLSDAQAYVNNYGILDIGQTYITDDGSTRLYVDLIEERKSPHVGLYINGTVNIDWGDNSAETEVTGSSLTTLVDTPHEYAHGGNYVISIKPQTGTSFKIQSSNVGASILWGGSGSQPSINSHYWQRLKKVELGSNVELGATAFGEMYNLEIVGFNKNVAVGGSNNFFNCYALKHITIPLGKGYSTQSLFTNCLSLEHVCCTKHKNTVDQNEFYNCPSLKRLCLGQGVSFAGMINANGIRDCRSLTDVIIPNVTLLSNASMSGNPLLRNIYLSPNITTINSDTFSGDLSLTKIKVPKISRVSGYTFNTCVGMIEYDFTDFTSVPTLQNTNAFSQIQSDCYIVVPDDLYEGWIATSNWSTLANYIISETDYNNL